ncbi:hypothetical protein [Natronorubrum aibiense]|uniref:DUF2238 domain-containing protein n=1 Tax=Natronorubrum aibiense TaxID=348826 RepID=A0A5P9P922_9EURY|nr:hypothetical protein [Natronorubrum aibiense]QFU84616.1 hypothetical protein GCU68_18955 [Natronorubrum aibiense]
MRSSVAKTIVHGTRSALVAVFVVGIRRRNPGAVVNAGLAFGVSFLPDLLECRFDIEFRPWQRVYTVTALLTHAIGMLGPYDDVSWWDHLTHVHSATLLGGFAHAAARRRGRDPRVDVVATVTVAGVLWELLEYAIHGTARRLDLEPILIAYGKRDTVLDLVFNLVGALLVLVFGDRYLHNFVQDLE